MRNLFIAIKSGPLNLVNNFPLNPASHCAHFFLYYISLSLLGLYLSDSTNIMIMSHYGISVVINVRLYDSQDA